MLPEGSQKFSYIFKFTDNNIKSYILKQQWWCQKFSYIFKFTNNNIKSYILKQQWWCQKFNYIFKFTNNSIKSYILKQDNSIKSYILKQQWCLSVRLAGQEWWCLSVCLAGQGQGRAGRPDIFNYAENNGFLVAIKIWEFRSPRYYCF